MKGQLKNGVKLTAVLLVTATLGLAQASMSAPVGYAPPSNAVGNSQPAARHAQAVPGTINYVEGQAMLGDDPLDQNAVGYAVAQPNQAIDTQNGYVEVLLTPGAFLRIGNNSEVVMQSLGLANIQLRVVRGSAMIESAEFVKGAAMQVSMDDSSIQIEKRGLYQFDANQQLVRVLDGKAKLLQASHVKTIDKGDQIALNTATLKSHSFDKQVAEADPLYVWSKTRSQAESQANIHVANNIAVYGGWYGPGWYWDPLWANYAFLPGAGFLYSPFGVGWGFYSPAFVYAAPFYGRGFYGHAWRGGVTAGVHGYVGGFHSGFARGGFHAGGHR